MTETIASLTRRIEVLEAEAEIRRVQARYMLLCDTPCPDPGVTTDAERVERIMDLYTEDAVWEGVGEYYDDMFGAMVGRQAIRKHFERFWSADREPALLLNAHYLTSEQITLHPDRRTADGIWIHMQPWLFADGSGILRSSRLSNGFRREPDGRWLITRTRTENVFIAPLPHEFASDFPARSVLLRP